MRRPATGTLATLMMALLTIDANAACGGPWRIPPGWHVVQGNGAEIVCNINPTETRDMPGDKFKVQFFHEGTCVQLGGGEGGFATLIISGSKGSYESQFSMTVKWPGGPVGLYTGSIDYQTRVVQGGITHDIAHPDLPSTWFRGGPLVC